MYQCYIQVTFSDIYFILHSGNIKLIFLIIHVKIIVGENNVHTKTILKKAITQISQDLSNVLIDNYSENPLKKTFSE